VLGGGEAQRAGDLRLALRPSAQLRGGGGCWSDSVRWERGDVFDPASYAPHLADAAAVVVSVALPFVEFKLQRRLNGKSNAIVARAAADAGVPRLVLVEASMPAIVFRSFGD
jgi:uncharacterized protein YbjT (DUF2867 family)